MSAPPHRIISPDGNLLANLPNDLREEAFQTLLSRESLRIERIISRGHTSPESGWWDQDEDEWIAVLQGAGTICFADGREVTLRSGDYHFIPAHEKHKVIWTEPDVETVWLTIFSAASNAHQDPNTVVVRVE